LGWRFSLTSATPTSRTAVGTDWVLRKTGGWSFKARFSKASKSIEASDLFMCRSISALVRPLSIFCGVVSIFKHLLHPFGGNFLRVLLRVLLHLLFKLNLALGGALRVGFAGV